MHRFKVQIVHEQLLFPNYIKMQCSYFLTTLQELLDMRQKQITPPQLVEEIRKQADDVQHTPLSWFFFFYDVFLHVI